MKIKHKKVGNVKVKAKDVLSGPVKNKDKKIKKKLKISFNIKKTIDNIKNFLSDIKKFVMKNKRKIFALLICIVIVFVIVWINNLYIIIKYKKYTDKIKTWGIDTLYTNGKSTAYEKASKLDVIKLVTGLSLNIKDVSGIESKDEVNFKNENWVKVAELYKTIDKEYINKKNYKKASTLVETSMMLAKSKVNMLKLPISTEVVDIDSKLFTKTKEEDKIYLNESILLGLLENKNINLKSKLNKGELSKLIVEFSEKTSAIHYDKNMEIETDAKNFPKTYKQYPYILKGIDKEIYDMPLKGSGAKNFNTPNTVYKTRKIIYEQTASRIKEYYNEILNVDYQTIDSDKLAAVVEKYSLYDNNLGNYINYANYVKKYKIQIKGNIETYLPITYYDGMDYRVRTKIDFEVLSSDTEDNLLLPDIMAGGRITYLDKKYSLYVDVMLCQSDNSISQRIEIYPINTMLVNETDRIIKK